MSRIISLAICMLLFACTACAESACPAWDETTPCTCQKTKDGIMVQCMGPAQTPRIVSALEAIRPSTPWDLQLHSVDLEELPRSVRSVSSLRLTNCNLGRLQKTNPLLWPRLNEVVFERVGFEESPWSQLRGAHLLKSVKVSDFSMVGQDFRKLPDTVEYLDLRKTETGKLQSGCMGHLKNLRYVFIADMPLTDFPRNALPSDMPQLHTFILGNTLVEKLESNFFAGMPNLKVLMLSANKFSTLDSQLFMPLRNHLTHLVAEQNPLKCECSLLWLKRNFQNKSPIKVLATCYDDTLQQFREVMKLDEDDNCS